MQKKYLYIYIYAFSRRFYPKQLTVHFLSVCVLPIYIYIYIYIINGFKISIM